MGRQARELDDLVAWLRRQPGPDVVCFSNALLLGMARRLKAELQTSVVCTLQGEDAFLDSLPESHREAAWRLVGERAVDVDLFIAPSRYFADLMIRRLGLGDAGLVRAGCACYNTAEEVDRLLEGMAALAAN